MAKDKQAVLSKTRLICPFNRGDFKKVRQSLACKVSAAADLAKLYLVTIQSSMGGNPSKVCRVSRRKPNHEIQTIQVCLIPNSRPGRKVQYRAVR
ncbi:hypothetical protein TNCV_3836711 [Trichonephila clavipes]|nr:hypothetical protein TNCV_3836711 [Trichonephila clavipes]